MPDGGAEFSIHRYDALPNATALRAAYTDYVDEIGRFIAYLRLRYAAPHWWWESEADVARPRLRAALV